MSRTCLHNGYRVSVSWYNKYVGPNALIGELRKSIRQSNARARRKTTLRRLKAKAVKVTRPATEEEKAATNLLIDTVIKGCSRKGDSLEDFVGGNYKLLLRCKA